MKNINFKNINWSEILTFNGKCLSTLLVILAIVGYLFAIDKGWIDSPEMFVKEVIIVKEIPIKEEVIKLVEKGGMKTSEFVVHINPRVDPIIAEAIGVAVDKYSKEYQIPKKLILSIIRKESFFNPFAKSKVAFGLMQIYPKFHKEKIKALGITDNRQLYHIDYNINIGCQIFREYFDATNGNLDETFHKYLSKKATQQQKDAYKNAILTSWARLEFMEYQRKNQREQPEPVQIEADKEEKEEKEK